MNRPGPGRSRRALPDPTGGEPLLADGAIGQFLFSLGFPAGYLACEAVVRAPQILASVHRDYAGAGARLMTTDTFDANLRRLDARGLAERCREINAVAADLARATGDCLVAGSIGPLDPEHSFRPAQRDPAVLRETFLPQVEGLLDGGADLLLLETQVDPLQAMGILDVVRAVDTAVPVAVSFTFGQDLVTPAGYSLSKCLEVFAGSGVYALGANHGIGPLQFLDVHRRLLSASDLPVLLEPNSGVGRYMDGSFVFPDNPAHYVRCMLSCLDRTAVVGGCCGTTPEFISLLARRLRSGERTRVTISWSGERPASARRAEEAPPRLAAAISSRTALVTELLPPRGGDLSRFLERAARLSAVGPLAVSIPDSPMGRVRVSPSITGLALRERLGVEPVVHFALRDRGLTRIQADLLAMAGAGLKTVFLISGDPPSLGDYPEASAVYDLSTDETLELIERLREGRDLNGRSIGAGAYLFPGSALSLGSGDAAAKAARRFGAGCRFFITQPVFSARELDVHAELLEEMPVLVALMPFRSFASASYLATEVPGIRVPERVLDELSGMDDSGVASRSEEMTARLMEELSGRCAGVYLAGGFGTVRRLSETWTRLSG